MVRLGRKIYDKYNFCVNFNFNKMSCRLNNLRINRFSHPLILPSSFGQVQRWRTNKKMILPPFHWPAVEHDHSTAQLSRCPLYFFLLKGCLMAILLTSTRQHPWAWRTTSYPPINLKIAHNVPWYSQAKISTQINPQNENMNKWSC